MPTTRSAKAKVDDAASAGVDAKGQRQSKQASPKKQNTSPKKVLMAL
jgi:hypothetical protein